MRLEDYKPRSFLETKQTLLQKPKFSLIDCHTHFSKKALCEDFYSHYDTAKVVDELREHGIEKVVTLDFGFGEARKRVLKKLEGFEDFFIHFGGVDYSRFEEPDFEKHVRESVKEGIDIGMRGLKISKNVGLGIQDKAGNYLRPDDERLSVFYETAAEYKLPVVIHVGDPRTFFFPIDGKNERYSELCNHPDWCFADPKFYRFEQLMEMQENMICNHPDTTFIIAHCGSYSENLRQVASWLDKYPNMNVDITARINELGRQPYTAKAFLEKYSERIFFGTDFTPYDPVFHPVYFRFLETDDEYFNPQGEGEDPSPWNIYGVKLSDEALKNIYHRNVKRLLGL